MPSRTDRADRFPLTLTGMDKVRIEEVFRLGALRDGVQLTTTDIRFPVYGQVVPRIELQLTGPGFAKKITVRVNQNSPFMFDGDQISAHLNGKQHAIASTQFIDGDRAPTGMYNFGLMRENGMRSFVFDYHTYCAFSCDFCFKESEWEILALQGGASSNYTGNFDACLAYVDAHAEEINQNYDIIWLCTGSITNEKVELDRHCRLATTLRRIGYTGGIYVSQVIPDRMRRDAAHRHDYLTTLREAGISRFNSGVEIVNNDYRQRYVHGYKGTLTFDDYTAVFADAVDVFGRLEVGSCLLAGIEPAEDTLRGLETIADLGVCPAPTVLTPFVVKQMDIPFQYDLDGLIDVHVGFNDIIDRYELPLFSGVFSLA